VCLLAQIVVPVDLADILKAYTKEVIRRNPANIVEFSAKYVALCWRAMRAVHMYNCKHTCAICSSTALTHHRRYFANLAEVSNSAAEASAPSLDQIKVLHHRAGEGATLTPEQVHALGAQLGIAKGVVAKVLSVGKFASAVSMDKFLFLLIVMSCENFGSVLRSIFAVFGDRLASDRFQTLISFLAPDMVCVGGGGCGRICAGVCSVVAVACGGSCTPCKLACQACDVLSLSMPAQDPDVTASFLQDLGGQLDSKSDVSYAEAAAVPCIAAKL
jgi:hypothetical protein